jgi:hypothetical protein
LRSKSANNRPRRLRPSTIAIIVGIFAFATYSALSKQEAASSVTYEADASGRLVRVENSLRSDQKPQVTALWKPEPDVLLSMQAILKLDTAQIKRINIIDSAWTKTKSTLEESIRSSTTFLENPEQLSVTSAHANLGEYSELSRQYGRLREAAWAEAIAVLTPSQQARLDHVRQGEAR